MVLGFKDGSVQSFLGVKNHPTSKIEFFKHTPQERTSLGIYPIVDVDICTETFDFTLVTYYTGLVNLYSYPDFGYVSLVQDHIPFENIPIHNLHSHILTNNNRDRFDIITAQSNEKLAWRRFFKATRTIQTISVVNFPTVCKREQNVLTSSYVVTDFRIHPSQLYLIAGRQ
jgi:hypothetical protein